jgi:hypothetical protein
MSATWVHSGFDVIAWIADGLSYYWLTRGAVKFPPTPALDWHYTGILVFGAGVGAVVFGTAASAR